MNILRSFSQHPLKLIRSNNNLLVSRQKEENTENHNL